MFSYPRFIYLRYPCPHIHQVLFSKAHSRTLESQFTNLVTYSGRDTYVEIIWHILTYTRQVYLVYIYICHIIIYIYNIYIITYIYVRAGLQLCCLRVCLFVCFLVFRRSFAFISFQNDERGEVLMSNLISTLLLQGCWSSKKTGM